MSTRASSVWGHDELSQRGDAVGADEIPAPRLLSGSGLERLYRSQASRLVRHFARSLGRDDASDLVHEAFTRLAAAPTRGGAIDSPEAFVTTIATNALRDRARMAARRALQDHQLACYSEAKAHDPQRLAESRETLRAVDDALAVMNPRRRQIFMLHRLEHMTYAEVGEVVGMSEKGVKKQIAKALIELRRAAGAAE